MITSLRLICTPNNSSTMVCQRNKNVVQNFHHNLGTQNWFVSEITIRHRAPAPKFN
jgi:hypothetical protein